MGEWQPIETAPKDFVTEIDLWNGQRLADCIWGWPTYGERKEGKYCWVQLSASFDCDGPID